MHRVVSSRASAVAILLICGGCATDPPPPGEEIRKQALPNVEIKMERPWAAGGTPGEVQDNWLATFNDPVLDGLVREALANNPDLRVAAARVEQSAGYMKVAQSALRPSIGIAGTGGAKAGGGSDPTSALQGIVAAASWELDLWGRVRYARNAAQQTYASAQADYEFARQSVAASTAKAYFAATQMTLNVAALEQMVEAAKKLVTFAESRERVGVGTDSDTAVARANVHDMENQLELARYARTQTLRSLEALIGRYPAAEIQPRPEFSAIPDLPPVGVPLQMLERRPDVIAAERRVAAAFHRVGEAKAARLPQITLNLNFGAFSSEILELKEDYENPAAGAGARLLIPLYTGGRLTAQVEIRTAEQKEAVADYARTALRALSDVENSLAASQSLANRVDLLNRALTEQSRALELSETRFRVGRGDQRAIEQQRLTTESARLALLDVRTQQLAERVNLHLALGGSFAEPEQHAEAQK